MQADGVFNMTELDSTGQPLPDLSVQQYNQSSNHDRYENTALTIDGRIGQLKAVYSGGYLVRNVDQVLDYTNYARGKYADYYQCILPGAPFVYSAEAEGPVASTDFPGICFSPSSTWQVQERNTHQSHEFRLSTPDDGRLRAIGGLFWEDYKIYEQADWLYKSEQAGFSPIVPPTGSVAINPNVRNENIAFFDDITRGYKQKAAFASVDFELIPKTLTLTAATRYYRINDFEVGSKVGSYGCRYGGIYSGYGAADGTIGAVPSPCLDGYSAKDLGLENLKRTYSGFRSRANISWKVTSDALVYATWSQGFRPGGYNRGSNNISPSSPVYGIFTVPVGYDPDTLTNNELGWKTQWLENRLQFNGAVYQEDWKNVQISLFDPGVFGNLVFTTNGPDYRVRGLETELVARVTNGLTVTGSAAWNDSELVNEPTLVTNTGEPIEINPYGAKGSPLAQAPRFQGNLRARYEFPVANYDAFVQVAGTHRTDSFSTTDRFSTDLQGNSIAYVQKGFSTLDASTGISRDAWALQLYGQNLTDVRGTLYASSGQYVKSLLINRPRTIGLRFNYKFTGN
jgi:outer membrane receptor protein involved in Fe transport